jgi:hypothetical protein
MLFKVSAFHAYTHQDNLAENIENCEICELAIESQQTNFNLTPSQSIKTPPLNFNTRKQAYIYLGEHASSFYRFSLYGRPPPVQV